MLISVCTRKHDNQGKGKLKKKAKKVSKDDYDFEFIVLLTWMLTLLWNVHKTNKNNTSGITHNKDRNDCNVSRDSNKNTLALK